MMTSKINPTFLTDLMKEWLNQYEGDIKREITHIGIFEWNYRVNRRNPEKPIKRPHIIESIEIAKSSFKHEFYFLQVDENKLYVYTSSGYNKAGFNEVYEYNYHENNFIENTVIVFRMIS